jgi:fructose-specific phosphotransferase system IIC component
LLGSNPFALLEAIKLQLYAAGIELAAVQFVAANVSMDQAKSYTPARLIILEKGELKVIFEGKLEEANKKAEEFDIVLAEQIEKGEIDGLILVSADPKRTNSKAVKAGADKNLPAVGTGGTSVAHARSVGLNVVAASGTTGSTNRTRAVSYAAGLANYWKLKYKPVIGSYQEKRSDESPFKRINFQGIMVTSLPAFIALAITIALSRIPGLDVFNEVFEIMIEALPVVVAVVAAKQVSGFDEVGIVAGVVSGVLSTKGGIFGGLLGGIAAGIMVPYLVAFSTKRNFPATTVNILSGGVSGLLSGLVMYFGFSPIALEVGNGIRMLIQTALDYNPIAAGAIAGLLIWPAIIGGVYHAAILPIILLEMEQYGNSFLGAIDAVGLVVTAAGITLANILYPRAKSDRVAAAPGFFILTVFGTFVEAAYPFMFADKLVFAAALVSATAGGAVAGFFNARGMAYVPILVAPFMSNNTIGFILSMLTALIIAFLLTMAANRIYRGAQHSKNKVEAHNI